MAEYVVACERCGLEVLAYDYSGAKRVKREHFIESRCHANIKENVL